MAAIFQDGRQKDVPKICIFLERTYKSDRSSDFDAWYTKRRKIPQGSAFWGLNDMTPISG